MLSQPYLELGVHGSLLIRIDSFNVCTHGRRASSHLQSDTEGLRVGLAQVLVEKARTEAEEAQRILLAALNGLAGLMILDSDRPQAVALYRKVCASTHLITTCFLRHRLYALAGILWQPFTRGV